jgi:hypothetical protein
MNGNLPEFWSFNRSRDELLIRAEDLQWRGPFSWIGFEKNNKLEPTPDVSGVYLFTFEYNDGYILRSVGITNSMKRRFSLFLASINPSSAELNFPSTPVPLLGFHGRMSQPIALSLKN